MIAERIANRDHKEQSPTQGGILAVHFKLHGGDGVSLQSQLLHNALRQQENTVFECCADLPPGANGLLLPELSYQSQGAKQLWKDIYHPNEGMDEQEIITRLETQSDIIRRAVETYVDKKDIHTIHVHNIFSLPYNPAATVAFYELARDRKDLAFIAQHHDLVYENRQDIFPTPIFAEIANRLNEALVPNLPNIQHVTINSGAADRLQKEKNIAASIIPDGFDFDSAIFENHTSDTFRERAGIGPNDLVIGVMTRFVPRKALEFAVQIVAAISAKRSELEDNPQGIGPQRRTFSADSAIYLVLPQHEDRTDNGHYFDLVKTYADQMGVTIIEGADLVNSDIHKNRRKTDKIPFYDIYPELDIACYPTTQEGFGNQLLESLALARHVVPVVFEYPVFQTDIAVHVPHIVSLGNAYEANSVTPGLKSLPDATIIRAIDQTILYLCHPDVAEIHAEENFQSAKRAYDVKQQAKQIMRLIDKKI